jgi:hypothetical protein
MRLVEQQRELRHRVLEIAPHYDQLRLSFDTNRKLLSENEWSELQSLCNEARIHPIKEKDKRANIYKQRLHLLQPKKECLILLREILSKKLFSCTVSYAEITIDWITDSKEDARYIQNMISLSLVKKTGKDKYHYCRIGKKGTGKQLDKTTYFTPKGSSVGIAMYSDRGSKVANGRPCAHLEIRLQNPKVCSDKALGALNELIDLDILELFDSTIPLFPRPTKSNIGKYLAELNGSKARTPQGYIKICNQLVRDACSNIDKKERPKVYKELPLQVLVNEESKLYQLLKSKSYRKEVDRYRNHIYSILFNKR